MRNLLSFGLCAFAVVLALSTYSATRAPHTETLVRDKPTNEKRTISVLVPAYGGTSLKAMATAYCPCSLCCGEFADGKTSIGDDAFVIDGVAADPRAIPYRTRVSIPGIGMREVDDTGGVMRHAWRERGEYHIDIRFATHDDALQWGRQTVTITILSQPDPK